MKSFGTTILFTLLFTFVIISCKNEFPEMADGEYDYNILFLHHSTGENIWTGNNGGWNLFSDKVSVPAVFTEYNKTNGTKYHIEERTFPKEEPYGWNNYPYDYYNIWVKHAGNEMYMEELTLEMLTGDYDMIIFKHCFPVSYIEEDTGNPDIDSPEKRVENYKLQYEALKSKMHEFPETKFIVWTGAALTAYNTTEDHAKRAREFFNWVKNEWDKQGDNIYLWDFYELETEGELFLKSDNAVKKNNSHPNMKFSAKAAKLFAQRILDVIETNGQKTSLTGEFK
ncbi:MAG: hypothetical protein JW731_15990 [Bacteroidales bacterium]|nr:hypothetical protein [Bacteroidales bacterium]